jgi:hypothetical protein
MKMTLCISATACQTAREANVRQVLVDKSQRSVLEFTRKDLDHQRHVHAERKELTPSECMYDTSLILSAPSRQVATASSA